MPVDEFPTRTAPAIDVSDPHRQVLVREVADASVLALHHDQHDRVTPRVRGRDLELGFPVGEDARPPAKLAVPVGVLTSPGLRSGP